MSIAKAMILFGAMLIYGGWKNLSIGALARGDNSTAKSLQPSAAGSSGSGSPAAAATGPSGTGGASTPVPGGRI